MIITAAFLYELSSMILCYNQICDYLGLSEEQRRRPEAGQWVIEFIREMHSDFQIRKAISLAKNIPINKVERNPLTTAGPFSADIRADGSIGAGNGIDAKPSEKSADK